MISVSSELTSTSNQSVAVFKLVKIPLRRSLVYVLADKVLVNSKPKIKLIVTENEIQGLLKSLDSSAEIESNWLKISSHEIR